MELKNFLKNLIIFAIILFIIWLLSYFIFYRPQDFKLFDINLNLQSENLQNDQELPKLPEPPKSSKINQTDTSAQLPNLPNLPQ